MEDVDSEQPDNTKSVANEQPDTARQTKRNYIKLLIEKTHSEINRKNLIRATYKEVENVRINDMERRERRKEERTQRRVTR